MGSRMSRHLLKAGHQLSLHDLKKETATTLLGEGATWARNLAQLASDTEIVFTSLPTPEAVQEVILGKRGVVESISSGAVVIDTSTNSLDVVMEVSGALVKKGVNFMDAPISGGIGGAQTRDLSIMASGDEHVYQRVKPVLDLMGDKVMYCGPVGHGTICKLCHQLFGSGMTQMAAEVLSLGVRAGVDFATLVEAISKGVVGRNLPLHGWQQRQEASVHTGPSSIPLRLMAKDIRLACELGRKFLVPMELGNIVEQRYVESLGRGWAELDSRVMRQLQEERAGVQLRFDVQRSVR